MYRSQIAEVMQYPGHHGDEIEAYLARPLDDEPHPSVVLLHHGPGGWDEFSIEMARKFAHHGFICVAPHLNSREGKAAGAMTPQEAVAAARRAGGGSDERMLGDVEGALTFLRAQPYSNGKVGVIGGCSGGRQSFIVGCRLPVDAAVDCWGGGVIATPESLDERHPISPIDMVADLGCPLLGIFGGDDYNPTALQVKVTEEALIANRKDYEFHLYPGAGHSFITIDEVNYRVDQALAAWEHIFTFLEKHLS